MNQKLILVLIPINLLLALIAISIASSIVTIQINSTSILIAEQLPGKLSHFQVSRSGVDLIWRSPYIIDSFHDLAVDDIDNNGDLEIVGVVKNRLIQLIDFESGEVEWERVIPSISTRYANILIGDVLGDNTKEIIYHGVSPFKAAGSKDYSIVIFDVEGNELQVIPSVKGLNIGPDNIKLVDFNADGKQEVLLSYGTTHWNSALFASGELNAGGYTIQHWSADGSKLSKDMEITGVDNGGNTEMVVLQDGVNSVIITAGWYNNPIRAFDTSGKLLWQMQTYEKNEFVQLASNYLTLLVGPDGPHLHVFQNNYWYNYTLSWFDLDPRTGFEYREKINFENCATLYANSMINDEQMIIFSRENHTDETESVIRNRYYSYNPKHDNELHEILHRDEYWINTFFTPLYQPPIDLGMENQFILTRDEYGSIFLANSETSLLFSELGLNQYNAILSLSYDKIQGSQIVHYPNVLSWSISLIIICNLLIIAGFIVRNASIERKFHKSFNNFTWKINGFQRVMRFFNSSKILPERTVSEQDQETFYLSEDIKILSPEITDQYKNFVSDWLLKNEKSVKKIKSGDIAILVEYLELSPDSVFKNVISDRLEGFPKSSIYRRIDFLLETGLLEPSGSELEDMRGKPIGITPSGIEFLRSVFSSLSFYFS